MKERIGSLFKSPQNRNISIGLDVSFGISAVFVALVIFQVLFNQLVWDDGYIIASNPQLGKWSSFPKIVTQSFWENSSFFDDILLNFWRPFTSFTLWATSMAGSQPWVFHGISIAAAFASTITFYLFLSEFLTLPNNTSTSRWCSLLYLAHPLTAEVICMVSNISDHLALTFFWATLIEILRYLRTPSRQRLFIIAPLAFLSCASKEFGILTALIPIIFVVLRKLPCHTEWIALGKKNRVTLWLSCALPAVLFLALRFLVLSRTNAVASMSINTELLTSVFTGLGLAIQKIVYFAPEGSTIGVTRMNMAQFVLSMIAVLAPIFIFQISLRRSPKFAILAFGATIAQILLIPSMLAVIPATPTTEYPVRYFHLAIPGYLISLAPLISSHLVTTKLRYILPVIAITLSLNSYIRITHWKDNVSLFTAELDSAPDSATHLINLSEALIAAKAFSDAEQLVVTFEKSFKVNDSRVQAEILSIKSQVRFGRDGDLESAQMLAEQAYKLHNYNPKLIERLARVLAAQGRSKEILHLQQRVMQSDYFSDRQKAYLQTELTIILRIKNTKLTQQEF